MIDDSQYKGKKDDRYLAHFELVDSDTYHRICFRMFKCSICDEVFPMIYDYRPNFCPVCGSKSIIM